VVKKKLKPGIPKRHLLLVATGVWLFAGGFLLFRGIRMLPETRLLWLKVIFAVIAGLVFFHLLFLRVSLEHITRIRSLEILRPCIFSFFDWKSYAIMVVMIISGVLARKSSWFDTQWLSLFFITMAVPLLLSAVMFLRAWVKYADIVGYD